MDFPNPDSAAGGRPDLSSVEPTSPAESADYERAAGILKAIIAALSARIGQDEADRDRLREVRTAYIELRSRLNAKDHDIVRTIIQNYPELVERIRKRQAP